MEHQHILVFGCLTLAVVISAFVLWGPSPRPKKKKGHIVGLVNLGSTCFLNTLLQALASCAVFIQWLSNQKQEENSLTSSLHHVLWILNGKGTGDVYAPVGVLSALKRHGWMVSSGEQDAHELFNVIVSTLQDESNKTQKLGSLLDVLSTSDTLSQASELEDIEEPGDSLNETLDKGKNLIKSSKSDKEDDSKTTIIDNSSSDTTANFSDAVDSRIKMNHGDGISHSSTTAFYSLEDDSPVHVKNECGDVEDKSDIKDNSLCSKSNLTKSYMEKLKASQESFKDKSPDFLGYYDRVTGCSPCIPHQDAPPFQGLLTSTLQCSTCGYCSSLRFDTFDSVSLPLGDNYHYQIQKLQDLLKKFVKTEIIPDVECEKCCKKTTAFKTLNFGKLPPCLCLRIARTTWHTCSRTPTKREDFVDFPEYLPMDEYTVSASLRKDSLKFLKVNNMENVNRKEKTYKHLYRLKSVVVHLGGVNSGHFLTYRRGALNTSKRHRERNLLKKDLPNCQAQMMQSFVPFTVETDDVLWIYQGQFIELFNAVNEVGKFEGACMDSQRWYLTSDDNVKLSTLYEAMDSVAYMLFYEKCSAESGPVESTNAPVSKKFCFYEQKDGEKD